MPKKKLKIKQKIFKNRSYGIESEKIDSSIEQRMKNNVRDFATDLTKIGYFITNSRFKINQEIEKLDIRKKSRLNTTYCTFKMFHCPQQAYAETSAFEFREKKRATFFENMTKL